MRTPSTGTSLDSGSRERLRRLLNTDSPDSPFARADDDATWWNATTAIVSSLALVDANPSRHQNMVYGHITNQLNILSKTLRPSCKVTDEHRSAFFHLKLCLVNLGLSMRVFRNHELTCMMKRTDMFKVAALKREMAILCAENEGALKYFTDAVRPTRAASPISRRLSFR